MPASRLEAADEPAGTRRLGGGLVSLVFLLALTALLAGCSGAVERLGIGLLYEGLAERPEGVLRDVVYRQGSELEKHRLDLFLPEGDGWPVLVFVPGGGWTGGDKGLVVSGADVYGNIGRFFAAHGIGAAVVNYRLQPEVTWREQAEDVAQALAWVGRHVAEHGGDATHLFLAGHSAGAQLAAFVALSSAPLAAAGGSTEMLCGVIPVSGAGYDLADRRTYELGAERSYYEERFRAGDPGPSWLREASAITYVSPRSPPFLLLYGSLEWKSLKHQNLLLHDALRAAGVRSRLLAARQGHGGMVLALSRGDKLPAREVLDFIRGSDC